MKMLILMGVAAVCGAVFAKPGEAAAGGPATNKKTPQELTAEADAEYTPDVMALLEAKYWRDVSNDTGRAFWHGKRTEAIADPSNMVTLAVYEDGRVFKDKAKVKTPKEQVDAANAKLPKTVDKKGVPKKLAEAREKRAKEKAEGVKEVAATLEAGAK